LANYLSFQFVKKGVAHDYQTLRPDTMNKEFIEDIISHLLYLSFAVTILNVYLTLNKLWVRKHNKDVAESISITGRFIAIGLGVILLTKYGIELQWKSMASIIILVGSEFFQILVGSGFWVKSEEQKSFWQLLSDALQLEKKESSYLAKSIFTPSNADLIIKLLTQIAIIDEVLDKRERRFIQAFADSWNISISWSQIDRSLGKNKVNYDMLRQTMLDYLDTKPPEDQAAQIAELIKLLVNIDNQVSEEEELMLAELMGLIDNYLASDSRGRKRNVFSVVLIPQNESQELFFLENFSEIVRKNNFYGGHIYLIGPYYSLKYAQIVCEKYRQQHFLCLAAQGSPEDKNYEFYDTKTPN